MRGELLNACLEVKAEIANPHGSSESGGFLAFELFYS